MIRNLYRFIKGGVHQRPNHNLIRVIETLPQFSGITLVDIGAAGDVEPRWEPCKPLLHYYGFEPDHRTREKLGQNAPKFLDYKIFPVAVSGKKAPLIFNLSAKPEASSIYHPNENF